MNFYEWLSAPAQENKTPEQLAKLFIESGPNLSNDQAKTLLHYTADDEFQDQDEFRLALIKELFAQKVDVNAIDSNGKTALHDFAAVSPAPYFFLNAPFADITQLFFQNGAQFNIQDKNGQTPLDLAVAKDNTLLAKPFIKFMLLENPQLSQPSSIANYELLPDYWNIYKNNITKLQEEKIPDTELSLYDFCAARNLTTLAKQHYFYHEPIQNFNVEQLKNKFYDYSDQLLVHLKSLQQELGKIKDTKQAIIDVSKSLNLNTDVVENISNYLSPKEFQVMHVAANPNALFKYKPELSEQTDTREKTTKSCCCIL